MGNKIITGNHYDKYNSKNFLVKFIMNKYFFTLNSYLNRIKFNEILEIGCGEGNIIDFVKNKFKNISVTGYDIDESLIASLKKRYEKDSFGIKYLDSKDFSEKKKYDLVLCLEVLEHIKNYPAALKNLSKIKSNYVLISVPNEPFFRLANVCRFKYLSRFGNTPGHVNNFSYFGFKKLIRKYFPNQKLFFKNCLIWNFVLIKK
jgi:2-polyprenyl-3-methyl-5-hydroxy-6-metoxy-1,4-benzoquinol methylase